MLACTLYMFALVDKIICIEGCMPVWEVLHSVISVQCEQRAAELLLRFRLSHWLYVTIQNAKYMVLSKMAAPC